MSNFHPLEVVGRGSEAQLQVGEIFIEITQQVMGKLKIIYVRFHLPEVLSCY